MIQVVLSRTQSGNLHTCTANGHSGFAKKGQDIVCAAVTVLLRTTLAVLETDSRIIVKTEIPKQGMLTFCVLEKTDEPDSTSAKTPATKSSLLTYAGIFLEKGIKTLQNEYPKHVSLHVHIIN